MEEGEEMEGREGDEGKKEGWMFSSLVFRLNTLERASIYEQTWSESWLDELDGDGSSFGESLDADPSNTALKGRGEKKGTESDVTVSTGCGWGRRSALGVARGGQGRAGLGHHQEIGRWVEH